MKESPPNPWIHIGECPECVDGLVSVRACSGGEEGLHLYATCDECEATWVAPDTSTEKIHPDPEAAVCPICGEPLFGEASRWALPADIRGSDWSENCIVELTSSDDGSEGETDIASSNLQANDLQLPGDRDEAPGC